MQIFSLSSHSLYQNNDNNKKFLSFYASFAFFYIQNTKKDEMIENTMGGNLALYSYTKKIV